MNSLEHVFTSLPWWKIAKEAKEHGIPKSKFSSNFLFQGCRHLGGRLPFYSPYSDSRLAIAQTHFFSKWVARRLPECDSYIGISGTGLHAGRLAKNRGSGYIMDRGSTQIRYATQLLQDEHKRWGIPFVPVHPWLIENEEAEAAEANIVTVPSDFVKNTFVQQGTLAEKIRVVPYGVALNEFHPNGVPPTDRFRLLFVGQFSIRKGAMYLLEAFRAFQHPKKELLVVGAIQKELKPKIESLNVDGIRFLGPVARSEVKSYMSTSHALVLPSVEEGLALVQGQALACGCPVIATPNTGSNNLYDHGIEGLIVEARSSTALTRAFEQLADDSSLRERMSQSALIRAQSACSWTPYAKSMLEAANEAHDLASHHLK